MKKKMNLTAIIAVVMVAMLSINLVSCTADEEYGDLAFGTLANGMFTRSEGNPGGDEMDLIELFNGNKEIVVPILPIHASFDFCVNAKFDWDKGPLSSVNARVEIEEGENTSELKYKDSNGNTIVKPEYKIMEIRPNRAIVKLQNNIFAIDGTVEVKYKHITLNNNNVEIENVDSVRLQIECPVEEYRSDRQADSSNH